MKKTRIHRVWILFLLSVVTCLQVKAQYMPVVSMSLAWRSA